MRSKKLAALAILFMTLSMPLFGGPSGKRSKPTAAGRYHEPHSQHKGRHDTNHHTPGHRNKYKAPRHKHKFPW